MDILQELKDKEKTIRELQSKKDKQEGQKVQLNQQLKTEFGVDSLEQAVTELEKIQSEVEKNDADLKTVAVEMDTIISNSNNKS